MADSPQIPAAVSADRRWTFGPAVLDERSLELVVSGEEVEVERKPLQVLLHLLQHAGEVVTKDELIEAVWPGRIISDAALTKCMAKLRDALRDDDQSIIKTQHGYGYRLIAAVKVEASVAPPLPKFAFVAGERVQKRPQWLLKEHLGTGGHGEAWLAEHEKTKDKRVFKFALDQAQLVSLKREITLYRLLHDALGDSAPIVEIIEWNLEDPPCFLELEHVEGGSLVQWAEAQGGLAKIPLETRLDLAAQIADALAQAHSIGVLHKDLKPSNVLVAADHKIKLSDFGSGGVLDAARLDSLGITRLGFTKTVAVDSTSGTPFYLAPEVLAGQPATVQADLYSLGVMLYQLIVGNFHRSLAPGWESEIADELLREDIADCAHGNPAKRLPDASVLATRLRTLEQRRLQRAERRAARERTERATRMRAELKRLRVIAAAMLALAVGAAGASIVAYRARNAAEAARQQAESSAATTQAVNDFLNKDLLGAADPTQGPTNALTVKTVLDRAGQQVDQRLKDKPLAAANVHVTLGKAYSEVGEYAMARTHLERAAVLYQGVLGATSLKRLEVLEPLSEVLFMSGQDPCPVVREAEAGLARQVDPEDERLISIRLIGRCWASGVGDNTPEYYDRLLALVRRKYPDNAQLRMRALKGMSAVFVNLWRYGDAIAPGRELVDLCSASLGAHHLACARERVWLSLSLTATGHLDEADGQLATAIEDEQAWAGDDSVDVFARVTTAMLRVEQRRFDEAIALNRAFLDSPIGRQAGSGILPSALVSLSEALLEEHQLDAAIAQARKVVDFSRQHQMPPTMYEVQARALWAEALREAGRLDETSRVIEVVTADDLKQLPEHSLDAALFHRSRGLALLEQGHLQEARRALASSYETYQAQFGADYWRTKRAKAELARLDAPAH